MPLKIENVAVPAVERDRPTRPAPPSQATDPTGAQTRSAAAAADNAPRSRRPRNKRPVTIDEALADRHRAVTNRVPGALWDQLVARADQMGVPIRVLLTDAIIQALELDPDDHGRNVRKTRRREQLAKIPPED
jgi:hypothetical protein